MKKNIILHLRICYWIGIIADGLTAISMTYYQLINFSLQSSDFLDDKYTSFGLMIGWTALLLWADRKPFERKGVILLTVFPVISLLIGTEIIGMAIGIVKESIYIPLIIIRTLFSTYFIIVYQTAKTIEKENNSQVSYKN